MFVRRAFAAVLSVAMACSAVGAESADDAEAAARLLLEGTKLTGGRILSALVEKCDLIDEAFVKSTGHEAHLDVMRCLNGNIGPVYYHHESVSARPSGGPSSSAFGSTWNGPAYLGPHTYPVRGRYVADVPSDFLKGLKKWELAARKGNLAAYGEVAAAVFTEANQGKGGYDDARMFSYFKTAGGGGVSDAIFMCAVCSYYGIGTPRNKAKAVKALKIWRNLSGKKVRAASWAGHLLSE